MANLTTHKDIVFKKIDNQPTDNDYCTMSVVMGEYNLVGIKTRTNT